MRKVVAKERQGKKLKKRYDKARTPLQRLIELDVLTPEAKQQLRDIQTYINPLALHRKISNLIAIGPIYHTKETMGN